MHRDDAMDVAEPTRDLLPSVDSWAPLNGDPNNVWLPTYEDVYKTHTKADIAKRHRYEHRHYYSFDSCWMNFEHESCDHKVLITSGDWIASECELSDGEIL
jgi:hypothetical protein